MAILWYPWRFSGLFGAVIILQTEEALVRNLVGSLADHLPRVGFTPDSALSAGVGRPPAKRAQARLPLAVRLLMPTRRAITTQSRRAAHPASLSASNSAVRSKTNQKASRPPSNAREYPSLLMPNFGFTLTLVGHGTRPRRKSFGHRLKRRAHGLTDHQDGSLADLQCVRTKVLGLCNETFFPLLGRAQLH